jgi:DNA-binding NarL/FixJ family response regulator
MPGLNGIEAAIRLKSSCLDSKLVCVTQQNDIEYLLAEFRAGVMGFVSKQDILGELIDVLRTVSEGDSYHQVSQCKLSDYHRSPEAIEK